MATEKTEVVVVCVMCVCVGGQGVVKRCFLRLRHFIIKTGEKRETNQGIGIARGL